MKHFSKFFVLILLAIFGLSTPNASAQINIFKTGEKILKAGKEKAGKMRAKKTLNASDLPFGRVDSVLVEGVVSPATLKGEEPKPDADDVTVSYQLPKGVLAIHLQSFDREVSGVKTRYLKVGTANATSSTPPAFTAQRTATPVQEAFKSDAASWVKLTNSVSIHLASAVLEEVTDEKAAPAQPELEEVTDDPAPAAKPAAVPAKPAAKDSTGTAANKPAKVTPKPVNPAPATDGTIINPETVTHVTYNGKARGVLGRSPQSNGRWVLSCQGDFSFQIQPVSPTEIWFGTDSLKKFTRHEDGSYRSGTNVLRLLTRKD